MLMGAGFKIGQSRADLFVGEQHSEAPVVVVKARAPGQVDKLLYFLPAFAVDVPVLQNIPFQAARRQEVYRVHDLGDAPGLDLHLLLDTVFDVPYFEGQGSGSASGAAALVPGACDGLNLDRGVPELRLEICEALAEYALALFCPVVLREVSL